MLPTQRHLFDIPDDVAYLNCAYMSPLLRSVREAGELGIGRKSHPWKITPPDFFTNAEKARKLFATLINASAEDIAIVPAASYGAAVAARNLPLRSGERVIVLDEQFPSNVYAWKENCRAAGAELVTVRRAGGGDWTEAVLAELDERVAIAALPHCHWTDGASLDLERLGAACRDCGAALVLDLTQSAGALPFDVARVQPDFAFAASYKWLLGPYYLGFLYVAPAHQQGEPLEHNWIDRANSEDFAALVNYRDDYQPGARRFDVGERANFHLLPMGIAALEQILKWSVAEIADTLGARNRGITVRARALGLECVDDARRAGHFLGLRFSGGVPTRLPESLAAHSVFVSVRGDSVRITPHLYNTDADVDRLFEALEPLL